MSRFLLTDKLLTQRTLPLPALCCLVAFVAEVGRLQAASAGVNRGQASNTVRPPAQFSLPLVHLMYQTSRPASALVLSQTKWGDAILRCCLLRICAPK